MKCSTVRVFLSEVNSGSVTAQVPQPDLSFLSTNGYLLVMQKAEYEPAKAEVDKLDSLSNEVQSETDQYMNTAYKLTEDEDKTHSLFFRFRSGENKEAEMQSVEADKASIQKLSSDIADKKAAINALIEKKSMLDRLVEYNGLYVALTGLGVTTLKDLVVSDYRVANDEFTDFLAQNNAINDELKNIATRANWFVARILSEHPDVGKETEEEYDSYDDSDDEEDNY